MFLLIDSGSVVAGCPRDWCPNIRSREAKQLRFQTAGENQTFEHYGEKDVRFTTAGHKSTGFPFQVRNVRFPVVSVYRLTQAGCKREVDDSVVQLRRPEKGTPDLDLIGGTLWLELWDLRTFFRGANTLFCIVSHGNSSGSRLENVSEEGGMGITDSRTGTGEIGRLRIDPKPLVVNEIEAEQGAVQISVRKGPVLTTADQVMKRNATHFPIRDWCAPCITGEATDGHIRELPILQQRYRGVNWTISS